MTTNENKILTNNNILLCLDYKTINEQYDKEYQYIKDNFCGVVYDNNIDDLPDNLSNIIVFMCGDIKKIHEHLPQNVNIHVKAIIEELSYNCDFLHYNKIGIGQVPINIHNVGIYFRRFYNDIDYFGSIKNEHKFQKLTESNKKSNAFRKGIYMTNVQTEENGDIKFNLLRCSSNLDGPTDNFKDTDHKIINKINSIQQYFFEQKVELNHVLAQIYENQKTNRFVIFMMFVVNYIWSFLFNKPYFNTKNTEKKAKIKAHSDKTKDMPSNAIMAFCTFYDFNENKKINKSKNDLFDYCYNNTSVLTKLHFRLKDVISKDENYKDYAKQFTITLYPNSVFLIPLSTNRLYTHEIKPSELPIDKIPTRMGYVIRCSSTEAIYKDGETFIVDGDGNKKLEKCDHESDDVKKLRELYFKENTTIDFIDYGKIYFSMNEGDYKKPNL